MSAALEHAYWNKDAIAAGFGTNKYGDAVVTGLTIEEFGHQDNFPHLDFVDTWTLYPQSDHPVLKPVIMGISRMPAVTVKQGTEFADVPLPAQVNVQLTDKSERTFPVTWSGVGYNGDVPGRYTLTGTLTLDATVAPRLDQVSIRVDVITAPDPDVKPPPAPPPPLSLSAPPPMPDVTFPDIAGHWAEAEIKQAAVLGIVGGYPDGTFRPDDLILRAEFLVMLMRALQWQGNVSDVDFTDRTDIGDWALEAVAVAVSRGLVSGYEDGTFRPGIPITRAELAVLIARAASLGVAPADSPTFADDPDIPDWAREQVYALHAHGLVAGRGSNRFAPTETATRTEAIVMIMRLLATIDRRD